MSRRSCSRRRWARTSPSSSHTFNSGTEALTAFQAGALDASYIGPSPTITAWTKLDKGVKIVSGAASGGAYFVVNQSINSAADLKGKVVASPQLGNTQDVALRTWLKSKGLDTDTTGGGDVQIRPQDNATTLNAFKTGELVGAWVPEPWATRLVTEGGGKILVDEADLWPQGQYVTTQLDRHQRLPQGPQGRRAEAGQRSGRGERVHQDQPVRRPDRRVEQHRPDHRQGDPG